MRHSCPKTLARLCVTSCVLACLASAGCATSRSFGTRGGHALKAETIPSDQLDLPVPKVSVEDGAVRMRGVVRRKPGYAGAVTGTLLITITAPNGDMPGQVLRRWDPYEIPVTGSRSAVYETNYVCLPPKDSTVTIEHYTSIAALLAEEGPQGGGVSTAAGGGGFRARARSPMRIRAKGYTRPAGRAFGARGGGRR